MKKNNKSNKDKKSKKVKVNYFISHSKLNNFQRKYCKCLMDIRPNLNKINKNKNINKNTKNKTNKLNKKIINKSKKNKITRQTPYGLCYYSIRKNANMHKTKKQKATFEKILNRKKTNCTMNYNYDEFDLINVQKMAEEFKIPIKYKSIKNKKVKYYAKSTLVKKLIDRYLKKQKK